MKKLVTSILALGLLGCLQQASAALTMRLSADGGLTWITVADGSGSDSNPVTGVVGYNAPIGDWNVNIDTGFGSPILGTPTAPFMDLGTTLQSSQAATLIVQLSDTSYTGAPNQTFIAQGAGFAGGTVTFTTFRDSGNVLFGTSATYLGGAPGTSPSPTASTLVTQGPESGNYAQTNTVVAPGGFGPYSLTLQAVIVHDSATHTSTDSSLTGLQGATCDCTLTFDSPVSITNCASDTIPDVTASQTCGGVKTAATVTFVGAVTNGTCPQIITRTYSAIDGCQVTHPFVQTLTLNCTVGCTLTLSTVKAITGSNYTASVADAGPGATYSWSIANGTIKPGPNTTSITWTAGADTSSPVTIFVTVTTGAGCKTMCNQGVPICPLPPQNLGRGETATIGFWHNKNGQALIKSAPNSPALGDWLGTNFGCMFGTLKGKSNADVAAAFLVDFGVTGQKTYAQVLAGAFAIYFTSSDLAGNGAAQYGFKMTPGGVGSHLYNVGANGTAIGLVNNQTYTILQILQAANASCPFTPAAFDALNTIFSDINQKGDIN
jgi:hypothetical protein